MILHLIINAMGKNVEYEINAHMWVSMCLYTCAHVHA